MPAKSSPLDVLPTSLIKSCRSSFAHIVARLANLSFEHATFPAKFKIAQVSPLLKKQGLDTRDPSSYRPISNLNMVSKVIERLVLARIVPHITSSPNFDGMQSAYRTKHSTEIALMKITNDVYESLDQHQSTLLVALDQSAAFDCIDHSIMIRRLEHMFGITDLALDWMTSYLSNRSFYVRWGNTSSSKLHVNTGVPQGSSIGPLCFSLYVAPLSRVLNSFVIRHHQYADDTQIYILASKSDLSDKVDVLQQCTLRYWLLSNGLQLNLSKSDVIQFVTRRGRERVDDVTSVQVSHTISNHPVLSRASASHSTNSCHSTSTQSTYAKRAIFTSELYDDDVAATVASSIISSRLDYCNSLITGMSAANFAKLQRVQTHSHESCNAVPSTTTSRRLSSSFTGYRFNNV